MKHEKATPLLASLLIFIAASPQFLAASTQQIQTTPERIATSTSTNKDIIEVPVPNVFDEWVNQSYVKYNTVTVEEWTNGTKLHISNYYCPVGIGRRVWVNFTQWFSLNSSGSAAASKPPAYILSGPWPYQDKFDGLWFLLAGDNVTHYVTYDHDDNYDRYHPLEGNTPYILDGTEKLHVHLPVDLLNAWTCGNISAAAVLVATFLGKYAVERMVKMGLIALSTTVASILECPYIAALLFLHSVKGIIEKMLELFGLLSEAAYVEYTIRERYLADGWTWKSIIDASSYYMYCSPYRTKPMTIYDYYQVRVWQQSWGREGIFSPVPQEYAIQWLDNRTVRSAPTQAVLMDYRGFPW